MAQAALRENGLQIGDEAPTIALPTDSEAHFDSTALKGKKNLVLYFYPKDATPGCTTEAQNFRDLKDAFDAQDTVILGISKDSCISHDKFKAKQALNFQLASDEEGDACERYGVWVEKNMYGKKYMGIQRATFLIAKDGNIAAIWPKVKVDGHAQAVLEATTQLNT